MMSNSFTWHFALLDVWWWTRTNYADVAAVYAEQKQLLASGGEDVDLRIKIEYVNNVM